MALPAACYGNQSEINIFLEPPFFVSHSGETAKWINKSQPEQPSSVVDLYCRHPSCGWGELLMSSSSFSWAPGIWLLTEWHRQKRPVAAAAEGSSGAGLAYGYCGDGGGSSPCCAHCLWPAGLGWCPGDSIKPYERISLFCSWLSWFWRRLVHPLQSSLCVAALCVAPGAERGCTFGTTGRGDARYQPLTLSFPGLVTFAFEIVIQNMWMQEMSSLFKCQTLTF